MATKSQNPPDKSTGPGQKAKPRATKSSAAKKTPKPGTTTQRNVKGTHKLPEVPGAEVQPKRNTNQIIGAAIARKRKGVLSNEQRRMLARATDGLSPLEFATSVLRDENASQSSRQWAAEVLMPYMHHRLPTAVQINPGASQGGGVLVAPSAMAPEEWMAQYGAQPADVVDIDFKEVKDLSGDDDA